MTALEAELKKATAGGDKRWRKIFVVRSPSRKLRNGLLRWIGTAESAERSRKTAVFLLLRPSSRCFRGE